MLPKQSRLIKEQDFSKVLKTGIKYRTPYFLLFVSKEIHNRNSCFGIVTSKKVGIAVKRNRARRIVRAILSKELEKIKPGYNVVLVCFNNLPDASFVTLQNVLYETLKNAKMYN